MKSESEIFRERLKTLLGWTRKKYEKEKLNLELKIGVAVTFEEWLTLQLAMFQIKGPPESKELI